MLPRSSNDIYDGEKSGNRNRDSVLYQASSKVDIQDAKNVNQ